MMHLFFPARGQRHSLCRLKVKPEYTSPSDKHWHVHRQMQAALRAAKDPEELSRFSVAIAVSVSMSQ
jgi:hypothetical protein